MYRGGVGGWHRFRTHIFYYRYPHKIYVAHIPVLLMHMARKGSTQSISTNFDRPKPSCTVLIVENHAGRRQLFWSNRLHWHWHWHWHCCDQIDCTGKKPRCSCAPGWRLMTRPIVQNWFNQSLLCHRQIHKYPPRYTKTNKARDMGHDPYSSKFNKTPHLRFVTTITTAGCVNWN